MKKLAVIDLGTNTFHILIATKASEGGLNEIYRERRFIKLAEEGIETIGKAAYQRGLTTMIDYSHILKEHGVEQVKAIGTAALRTASNGPAFVEEVREKAGIAIELIDGSQEAALIHRGVDLAVPFGAEEFLIMDIGGGSVEFIIANAEQVHWAQSFPIGVAVLRRRFHEQEPMSADEVETLTSFLEATLLPLREKIEQFKPTALVGASGTFDVLENKLIRTEEGAHHSKIDTGSFQALYEQLLGSTLEERHNMEGIPSDRADMIVVALVLIDYVLKATNINRIIVSHYAMKEGAISLMI